ncbi:SdpI family protein [Flavobacterium sp. P21]|uniref:SdpI family protein n=1 Tax=Flavobacterium sp. P21 TaxID=3423948 RepID=UPI003D679AFB
MHILVGLLIMVLGNYFKVIQPNYFIGIRTPWTLENKEVWKATHTFAGKLWFFGGFFIVLGGILFSGFIFAKAFVGIGITLALVPVVYSFFKFKQLEKKKEIIILNYLKHLKNDKNNTYYNYSFNFIYNEWARNRRTMEWTFESARNAINSCV